jgi:hypothetical protein
MFKIDVATYDRFIIQFQLGMDNDFWVALYNPQSGQNEEAIAVSNDAQAAITNNYGGSAARYVAEKVIPEATEFLQAYFGVKEPTPGTGWEDALKVELSKYSLDTTTFTFRK